MVELGFWTNTFSSGYIHLKQFILEFVSHGPELFDFFVNTICLPHPKPTESQYAFNRISSSQYSCIL